MIDASRRCIELQFGGEEAMLSTVLPPVSDMAGRHHGSQEGDERDSYKLYVVDSEAHQAQPRSHSALRQVVDFVSFSASDFITHDVHAALSQLRRFTAGSLSFLSLLSALHE